MPDSSLGEDPSRNIWTKEMFKRDLETLLDDDDEGEGRRESKAEDVRKPLKERARGELPQKPCK